MVWLRHPLDVRGRRPGRGLFALWGLGFVCVGLYFVVGRFGLDAWVRRGTRYGLTDRRILILRSKPVAHFTTISLDRLDEASLSERANGSGTIRFGRPAPMFAGRGLGAWTPSLDPTPQFLAIEDVRHVFDMVQRTRPPIR